jgi:hypothetical protein
MPKTRIYDFIVGPQTATLPTAGTPTDPSHVATKAYVDANSGGGGGSSLVWFNDSGDGPVEAQKYNHKCWAFEDGASQNLYCIVRVPSSYTAGNPIAINIAHFHEAGSATQLLLAQSTLVSIGAAIDSTTNQRTTNNTASAGGNKVLVAASLDITSSIGEINAVAVAAGDLILVKLYRGTDASTSDVYFVESATEVTFA